MQTRIIVVVRRSDRFGKTGLNRRWTQMNADKKSVRAFCWLLARYAGRGTGEVP
jgi:hypothetical protein